MTRVIQRETGGHRYYSYAAEYQGVSYEFDPVRKAMQDAGVTELTPENYRRLARKIIDYAKFGRQRAYTGAALRFMKEKVMKGEDVCVEAIFSAIRAYQPPV